LKALVPQGLSLCEVAGASVICQRIQIVGNGCEIEAALAVLPGTKT